ncbi:hypothetical protein [Streptomyces sp. NPDC059262]|uniref:hypothetical protein n=1 Tax=Streptomyces sp. NPDC059262 TaxID=3346797 RepID=UPI0036B093B3
MIIDWAKLGTVVAVVAGIGTLLFSGVATYYQALVSTDQLEQSREEIQRDKQDQASRVSFWEDLDGASPERYELHLMNRSPDPVSNLEVILDIWIKTIGKQPKEHYISIDDLNLAPCTEVVLTEGNLKYRMRGRWHPVERASWVLIGFIDRDGAEWLRTPKGLYSSKEAEGEVEKLGRGVTLHLGSLTKTPQVKNASACGESN